MQDRLAHNCAPLRIVFGHLQSTNCRSHRYRSSTLPRSLSDVIPLRLTPPHPNPLLPAGEERENGRCRLRSPGHPAWPANPQCTNIRLGPVDGGRSPEHGAVHGTCRLCHRRAMGSGNELNTAGGGGKNERPQSSSPFGPAACPAESHLSRSSRRIPANPGGNRAHPSHRALALGASVLVGGVATMALRRPEISRRRSHC